MKMIVAFLLLLMLSFTACGCVNVKYNNVTPNDTTASVTEAPISDIAETEVTTASSVEVDTTYAETQETEPIMKDTEPVETVPEVTQPIEVPTIPKVHTNITHREASHIIDEIYAIVSEYEKVSVYFMDVQQEYWFGIGEEMRYHTASTIKAVYCQYLVSSGIDMNMEIYLQSVSRTSASGKLTQEAVGSTFTVGELIEYSIRYSDNQAYRLLYETFGVKGYNLYASVLGSGGLLLDEEVEWTVVTAEKLSYAMLDIYRYSETNDILTEHLQNTDYNEQISAGTEYRCAHKYGSNGGANGYHDTAIVYAPERPYILTILTEIDINGTDDKNVVFRRISELCDKLNSILCEAKVR